MRTFRCFVQLFAICLGASAEAGIFEDNPPSFVIRGQDTCQLGVTTCVQHPTQPTHVYTRVHAVHLERIDGHQQVLSLEQDVDLMAGFTLALPPGCWVLVDLDTGPALVIDTLGASYAVAMSGPEAELDRIEGWEDEPELIGGAVLWGGYILTADLQGWDACAP